MVVTLTIGLSLASRTITNLRTSTEEENSQRAFSAAEAGIEQALKSTGTGQIIAGQNLDNSSTIKQVKINQVSGAQVVLNAGNPVQRDDGVDIWLTDYPGFSTRWNGNLTVYWGVSANGCNDAAVEIIVLNGPNKNDPDSTRYTADPCLDRREGISPNRFSAPETGSYSVNTRPFTFRYTIPVTPPATQSITDGILIRVIPLYENTPVGVIGTIALPSQGRVIESIGTSGGTERKIVVVRGYPKFPTEFFQYTLFSP